MRKNPRGQENKAAQELGRLGGLAEKSKPQGFATLSARRRKQISELGVKARKKRTAA